MIIYEVSVEVDTAVAAAYRQWLDQHVAQILRLPGFLGASLFDRLEPAGERTGWVVHYQLVDDAALQHYYAEYAPRLRQEGLQRFPGQFSASRRVLRPVSTHLPDSDTPAAH